VNVALVLNVVVALVLVSRVQASAAALKGPGLGLGLGLESSGLGLGLEGPGLGLWILALTTKLVLLPYTHGSLKMVLHSMPTNRSPFFLVHASAHNHFVTSHTSMLLTPMYLSSTMSSCSE